MDSAVTRALASLASQQAGVFSVGQAVAGGVNARRLASAARRGDLVRVHPKVFALPGPPLSTLALSWAGLLQTGARAVTHEAALHAHGLPLVPYRCVVSGPPGRHAGFVGIEVHRFGDLRDEHLVQIGGLTVATVERTVVDLASVVGRSRLEWLVDELSIVHRAVTFGGIARCLRQCNRRGRLRIANLQQVLDARSIGDPVPRSRLERRLDEVLALTGLPVPTAELPLPGWDGVRGFVDRAWPEVRLIVEVDGRTWHSRERSMAQDRARDRAAAAAGWLVVRVLGEEVRDVPAALAADIVAVYRARADALQL